VAPFAVVFFRLWLTKRCGFTPLLLYVTWNESSKSQRAGVQAVLW